MEGEFEMPRIHEGAIVGEGTRVWGLAEIREHAVVGDECTIGTGVYVDIGVRIGNRCKIQNGALIYAPAVIEDEVFVGPGVILTNDPFPRATNPDFSRKTVDDWSASGVTVRRGASLSAGVIVLAGITVGAWAMIGAGSVVTRDIPDFALMTGVPARRTGWVGKSGTTLVPSSDDAMVDTETGDRYQKTDTGVRPT